MILTKPDILIRIEGAVVLVASVVLFRHLGGAWGMFFLFILLPDISIAPYLINKHIGTACYNAVHSYAFPISLGAWVLHQQHGEQFLLFAALIWIAHIGMDRALGLGLKYPEAFRPTHIQSAAVFRGAA